MAPGNCMGEWRVGVLGGSRSLHSAFCIPHCGPIFGSGFAQLAHTLTAPVRRLKEMPLSIRQSGRLASALYISVIQVGAQTQQQTNSNKQTKTNRTPIIGSTAAVPIAVRSPIQLTQALVTGNKRCSGCVCMNIVIRPGLDFASVDPSAWVFFSNERETKKKKQKNK